MCGNTVVPSSYHFSSSVRLYNNSQGLQNRGSNQSSQRWREGKIPNRLSYFFILIDPHHSGGTEYEPSAHCLFPQKIAVSSV